MRRTRANLQTAVVIVLTTLMMAFVAAPIASAAIGATTSPLSTAAPDLRTVAVDNVAAARAKFCFDQAVASFAGNFASFHLRGYDDVVFADGTSIGADSDAKCLLVDFGNSASDISQYTIGTVDPGAVTNAALSNANVESAAALTNINLGSGGIGGRTTTADLVSAATDPNVANDVLFTYDEKLSLAFSGTGCDASKYGFYNAAGADNVALLSPVTGCTVSAGSPTVARVSFGGAGTSGAVRFFSAQDAVLDRGGDGNTGATTSPLGSTTTSTGIADLTGVNRINATTVDYTFDKGTAASCDNTKFRVVGEDGTPYSPTACAIQSSTASTTVARLSGFSTTNFSPFETPTAYVEDGALDIGNTEGARPLGTSKEGSGFTDAIDLESADFDTSFNQVTYNLDENVDPGTVGPSQYCVTDNNDAETCSGGPAVSVTANQVVMPFSSGAINTAVGALVKGPGAGGDFAGNFAAEASVGRGAPPSAGTIQFSSTNFTVGEGAGGCPGGGAQLTVTRTGGSFGAATVNYATSNGNATAGSDYTATSSPPPLSWADGDSTSKTICVPILQDALVEGSENFNVALSGTTGAALGSPSSASVNINDDEVNTGNLSFSASTYTVSETGGSAVISVVRSGGSSGTVSVDFATSNGSALAGSDYTTSTGTLTFTNGVTLQTFSVPITNDTNDENDETVNLALSNPQGGGGLTAPTTAILTIVDDDTTTPGALALSSAGYDVAEDSGPATITVNRTGGSSGTVSVNYAVNGSSAISGTDFTPTAATLTFGPGEVTKTFSVPIIDDSLDESDETASIVLSSPTGGATLGSPSTATLTIIDDDTLVSVPSDITLDYKPRKDKFTAHVFFPGGASADEAAACKPNRVVVLRKFGSFLRSATTGPNGWANFTNFSNVHGNFRATLRKRTVTLTNGTFVCGRGQSNTLFL
jgi:hypothetical protein